MFAGLKSGLSELEVVVWRRCDDDDIDFGVREEVLYIVVVLEIGVVCWG